MRQMGWIVTLLALGVSVPGAADAQGMALDAYYVAVGDVEIDDAGFDDGDGFGLRGRFTVSDYGFVSFEYQESDYESLDGTLVDAELTGVRAGVGVNFGAGVPFYASAEFVSYDMESSPETLNVSADDKGYAVHLGAAGALSDLLQMHGQIGYVDVDSLGDGMEFQFGAAFMLTEAAGLFADFRYTTLTDDADVERRFNDIRVGVRFAF